MKRLILLSIISILLLTTPVMASDISSALYRATITVSNNSTETTNVATIFSGNISSWSALDYMNTSGNNTAIISSAGADLAYMPGYYDQPWVLFVPSIGTNSYLTDRLYMGGESDMAGLIAYFPDSDGMTTEDDSGLELSDNFSISQTLWVDTTAGANKYLVRKDIAVYTFVSDTVSGNITSEIRGGVSWVNPTGYNDPSSAWTNETKAYNDNTVDYAESTVGAGSWSSYLELTRASTDVSQIRYWVGGNVPDKITQIDIDYYYSSAWHDMYEGAVTTGDWETQSPLGALDVTNIRIRLYNSDSVGRAGYIYELDYGQDTTQASVTATGLSSGNMTVTTTANSTYLSISINGEIKDSVLLSGASVPDNDNDWYFIQNDTALYLEEQTITIGGTLQQQIEWEYDITFADLSGNGHDAMPTFRTTSSDADVSANITFFGPISTAIAPAFSVSDAPLLITANITTTGSFTSSTTPAGGPPGAGLIDEAADAGGTPRIWLWGILAIFSLALIGLFISWMEKNYGSGGGSLTLRIIIAVTVLGILIAIGKFDWWMIIFYLIISLAITMMSRQGEVGGLVSQHGVIGFLATSWIGLTIINRILEGQFLTTNERVWANYYAFTQEFKVLGIFSMPVLNFDFFTYGIPSLIKWDYSFFGGNAQMFQYLLYSITAIISFIVFGILISLLYNAFRVR